MNILYTLYLAINKTINDDGIEHAGYMSFMVLLSFFPFVVFFLALTSFLGTSNLGTQFVYIIINNLPDSAVDSIKPRIDEILNMPPYSLMTLAVIGTIWTSSSFVEGLRTILNRVYQLHSTPPYIFRRILSILQFLLINALIYLAMIILILIPMILTRMPGIYQILQIYSPTWTYIRYGMIFLSLFLTTASLYYIIPNVTLKFKDVMPGAFIAVILWLVSGNFLSRYIIYYRQLNIVYGSLGSIIVTLIFFYVLNVVFIYGAEINYILKNPEQEKV